MGRMRREVLDFVWCPACQGTLAIDGHGDGEIEAGELRCTGCGHRWPVEGGIPDLVFPEELGADDAASRRLWNRIARFYDWIGPATNVIRGVSLATERRDLVARLGLAQCSSVLEIATGTGENLRVIAQQVSDQAPVFGVDLSRRMISQAARKLTRTGRPEQQLLLGNAMYLPFPDGRFDAVLDGFGMKYYSDKRRAIREMLRVLNPGGRIVIAELGVPQGRSLTFRQRLLRAWIPHFDEPPPLDALPEDVRDLTVSWDAHETSYVIEFRKPAAQA